MNTEQQREISQIGFVNALRIILQVRNVEIMIGGYKHG